MVSRIRASAARRMWVGVCVDLSHRAVGCMACWLGADVVGLGMRKDAGIYSALALGLVMRGYKENMRKGYTLASP